VADINRGVQSSIGPFVVGITFATRKKV
jgi:hypothetical protein